MRCCSGAVLHHRPFELTGVSNAPALLQGQEHWEMRRWGQRPVLWQTVPERRPLPTPG